MGISHQTPPSDLVALPLFPLNVVLFPGMSLPLHIFEDRYKAMIGDCIDHEEPFGVVLIQEGKEVGDPASPFQIGTAARILQVEHLKEGRINILTRGEHRFETAELTQSQPHLVGQVRYLEEPVGEVHSDILDQVGEQFGAFLRNLSSLAGGWTARTEVSHDPVRLSYGVAAILDLPRHARQELLESPTAGERLDRVLPLLTRGNEALQQKIVKRNPFQGPRLN